MLTSIHRTRSDVVDRFVCFFFIVSLGMGEVISFGSIKLSYLATLVFLFYSTLLKKKLKITLKKETVNLLICFVSLLLYSLVEYFWAIDTSLWLDFFRTLVINVIIVFLIVNYIETDDDWIFVARSFLFLILLCLLVGIWEYRTSQHLSFVDYSQINENTVLLIRNKPQSFYGNMNDNSSVLFLGLVVSFILFDYEKTDKFFFKVIRILFCVLIVLEIIIINARAITYSVGLLLLLILCFWMIDKLSKGDSKRAHRIIWVIVFFFVFSLILALSTHPLEYYLNYISAGTDYMSDVGRIRTITRGFDAFKNTFFLGLGPGQSIAVCNINLHSLYLEILFEYGFFIGGNLILQFWGLVVKKTSNVNGLSDYTIRSYPIVLLLAGVSSSKLFSLRPFWIAFSIIWSVKYRSYDSSSIG